jgi:hypothetical protein
MTATRSGREVSADLLPNLLVVGAMRSGTTTAYRVLSEHPEVFMSPWKEPHFLGLEGKRPRYSGPGDDAMNRNAVVSESTYRELFRDGAECPWRGEASASYLYLAEAVRGIRRYIDDPRLVILLRDPVDRAYSAYQYMRGQEREPCDTFAAALADEERRIADGWAPMWHYRRASHYRPQLERLFAAFPSDRIHVSLFDDLEDRPGEVFGSIFAWLGVDDSFEVPVSTHNRSGPVRSRTLGYLLKSSRMRHRVGRRLPARVKKPLQAAREANVRSADAELAPALRRELIGQFRDDIEYVEQLTGRRLTAWKSGGRSLGSG